MDPEKKFIGILRGKPTLQGLQRSAQEEREKKIEKAIREGHNTEADFLAEIQKNEEKKRQEIERLAEQVPQFLSQVDECVKNYHAQYHDNEKKRSDFAKYDELLTNTREAIEVFLTNVAEKEFVELLEHDIAAISDLCKEIYKLDTSFPNLAFLDEERFLETARESLKIKDKEIKVKFQIGRFKALKSGSQVYLVDQQAAPVTKKRIVLEGKPRNDSIPVELHNDFMLSVETRLFSGRTGEFSQGTYKRIEPGIGELWIGVVDTYNYRENYTVLEKDGNELYGLGNYVANKDNTRALVRVIIGYNYIYNVLLSNGKFLFDMPVIPKEGTYDYEDSMSLKIPFNDAVSYNEKEIRKDIIFGKEGKYVRLNKNLEVVAEGITLEEVQSNKEAEAA